MLKRFFVALFLCTCIVLSVVFSNLGKPDINPDASHYKKEETASEISEISEVSEISENEDISDDQNEILFQGNENLKIIQAITLVSKTYAKLKEQTQVGRNNNSYEAYLNYAISNGIIEKNQFSNYESEITKLEFATLCYKIVEATDVQVINNIEAIPDLDKQNEKYNEIKFLYELGIIVGLDEFGTFEPNSHVTGFQAIQIIDRIIYPEKRVKKEFIVSENVRYMNFKDKVTSQICNSKDIFVCGDTQVVSEEDLDKLKSEIEKFGGTCGFYLITLDGKFSIGYNIDQKISSASTVKAPYSLYVVKQIESGNGNYDEILEYKKENYRAGSGIIRHSPYGTKYTLEEILYHTINVSDNIGYYMLQDRFGLSGYNNYLDEIGCSRMKLTGGVRWGYVIPREAALVWNEIYNYSKTSTHGKKLFELFVNAKYNFIKQAYLTKYDSLDYEIAHKSGFNKDGRHDTAIVLLEGTPYFITITTKPDEAGKYKKFFNRTALILEGIMQKYVEQNSN